MTQPNTMNAIRGFLNHVWEGGIVKNVDWKAFQDLT